MALPLVSMLGLASGAISLLNKALAKPTPQGFESLLAGQTGNAEGAGAALIKGILAKLKANNAEASDLLAASGAGTMIFQLMAALKDAGLGAADIQALMTGNGLNFSDDMLKKMLSSFGVSDTQVQTILADKGFKEELKSQIMEGIQTAMGIKVPVKSAAALAGTQTGNSAPASQSSDAASQAADTAAASQSAAGKNTPDVQANKVKSEHPLVPAGVPQQIAAAVQNLVLAATQDDETLNAVLKEAAAAMPVATSTLPEIKTALMSMIQGALKRTEVKSHITADVAAVSFDELQADVPQTDAEVVNAVSTLQNTIGIKKDVLEKLFFATDPAQRQAAVDEVTSQVAGYLKQQGDKPLTKDVKQALSLVRSATTKEEWTGVDNAIKLWRPDLQVPETKVALDKGLFKALAEKVAAGDAGQVFDRSIEHAIDQIKIQLPSQLKAGESGATMRLHPPLLGRVDINIAMEDGKLQATIRTDTQFTKDMLQTNIAVLKDALADQGIRVAQLSITTGLDLGRHQQQDAYAQLQQGRSNGDGQGRGSQHPGQQGADENALAYTEAQQRGRLMANGGLDLFA